MDSGKGWSETKKTEENPQPCGWICPRCGRSNSPYTTSCDCQNRYCEPYYPPRQEIWYYTFSGAPNTNWGETISG